MPRWLWWVPLAVITLVCALLLFRLGWIAAFITETEVIDSFATRYLEDRTRDGTGAGAQRTDCVARPGADLGIWLLISCGSTPRDPKLRYEYHVDRWGRLVHLRGPQSRLVPPPADRPET